MTPFVAARLPKNMNIARPAHSIPVPNAIIAVMPLPLAAITTVPTIHITADTASTAITVHSEIITVHSTIYTDRITVIRAISSDSHIGAPNISSTISHIVNGTDLADGFLLGDALFHLVVDQFIIKADAVFDILLRQTGQSAAKPL